MNKNQSMIQVMEGVKIINTSVGSILFRCPPEIVKVLTGQGIDIPAIIVLPERGFEFGINQDSLEFPLYHFLFIQQGFSRGKRLIVICHNKQQTERHKEILRLTLLGPTKEEMDEWRIPEKEANYWLRLSRYFALKDLKGEVVLVDEMVNFKVFNEKNETEIGKVKIIEMDKNVFKVIDGKEEILVDINLNERQSPPIPITAPSQLIQRPIFGALALSICTTGFDPAGYTSGLVVWLSSFGISIDGVAWMKEHLYSMGINPNEIKAHLITHIHGDHSEILDLLINGKRAIIMTTKLIKEMFFKKIALILDMSIEEVGKMVDFVEMVSGEAISWYGNWIECWNNIHPIPTIGIRIDFRDKSIIYGGDTLWGEEKLTPLVEKGVLDSKEKNRIMTVPYLTPNLIFFDVGEGIIHPSFKDLLELPRKVRKRLVPTHVGQLSEEFAGLLNPPPQVGQEWVIVPQDPKIEDFLALSQAPLFQGIDPSWINVFLSQGNVRQYPSGEIILEQEKPGKDFHFILNGTAKVLIDGERITWLSRGDFFGDTSLLKGIPCTATIKTLTPIKVLEIPESLFLKFVYSTGIQEDLRRIYEIRSALMKIAIFKNLSPDMINWIIKNADLQEFVPGDVIVEQGERGDRFYLLLKGRAKVEVKKDGCIKRVAQLFSYHCFGERALLENEVRMATIRADDFCKVAVISREFFEKMIKELPGIYYGLRVLCQERIKDTAQKVE